MMFEVLIVFELSFLVARELSRCIIIKLAWHLFLTEFLSAFTSPPAKKFRTKKKGPLQNQSCQSIRDSTKLSLTLLEYF